MRHIDETSFASFVVAAAFSTKNKQKTWALKGVKNKLHNAEQQKGENKTCNVEISIIILINSYIHMGRYTL